jgi:hypothetical protein
MYRVLITMEDGWLLYTADSPPDLCALREAIPALVDCTTLTLGPLIELVLSVGEPEHD